MTPSLRVTSGGYEMSLFYRDVFGIESELGEYFLPIVHA